MWNIVQCAVQGRGHIKTETPCQDKTFSLEKNGVIVISLADGAGSAKLSHYGAETITRFVCEDLTENFDDYYLTDDGAVVKKELTSKIILKLNDLSSELNCEIKELASTLMFVAVKEKQFIIAHIGDGVVGYLKNDELKIASQPENGEFANTTVFTTSEDALTTMKLIKGEIGNVCGFVLMSDGAENSLYSKRENKLADVLKQIMQLCKVVSIEKLEEQLLDSFETTIKQATNDDCSIVLMVENDLFVGFNSVSAYEKKTLLKNRKLSKKQIKRYTQILNELSESRSLDYISRKIHLKPRFAKKHLQRLIELDFVEQTANGYTTILIL